MTDIIKDLRYIQSHCTTRAYFTEIWKKIKTGDLFPFNGCLSSVYTPFAEIFPFYVKLNPHFTIITYSDAISNSWPDFVQ